MDFISAFGNLRARNYGIEEIDKFAAKLKARDIASIATVVQPWEARSEPPRLQPHACGPACHPRVPQAGRIIPAIATTTAMATGFVCLELYKHLAGRPLTARRNLFANLALPGPLLMLSEPMPCPKIKSGARLP
eukprot:scaffold8141_cov63-Phaeocystis_antarctica.AAC.1